MAGMARLLLVAFGLYLVAQISAKPVQRAFPYEKRALLEKRYALEVAKTNVQPGQVTYYYYLQPDGTLVQTPLAQAPVIQQLPVQQQLISGYKEVPYQQVSSGSGGGLFTLLSKPFSTVSKVVGLAGDVVQGVVNVPFSVAKDVVQGVGLGDTAIGQVATGILDTGAALENAKVELVKNVVQLPFDVVGNVVGSLDG